MKRKSLEMGCLLDRCRGVSGEEQENDNAAAAAVQPTYSWDKRPRLDPKDYMFDGCVNDEKVRLPGTINGRQFMIRNCKQSSIYLFDRINCINVDDCEDCKIFIGPVSTSVFIRDCKNCEIVVSCQQLRTRDCVRLSIFLSCVTQPIIEASSHMKFGPYQYHYPELKSQFEQAGHSVFNSIWSDVYDFTPVDDQSNFSLLPEDVALLDLVPPPSAAAAVDFPISAAHDTSVVPLTHGKRRKPSEETCFVAVFADTEQRERAWRIVKELQTQTSCLLIQTHETKLEQADASSIFRADIPVAYSGPVIGLEYNGTGCVATCQRVVRSMGLSDQAVHVSADPVSGATEVDRFYNTVTMNMNAH